MKKIILFSALLSSIGLFAKGTETIRHKVQPKETLFRISLMYNSTVHDIEQANPGINARRVAYGSVIRVPKDTKMRDPEFVAAILNGDKPETVPAAQIAATIRAEERVSARPVQAERPKQISMPVQAQAAAPKAIETEAPRAEEIKKAEEVKEVVPVAIAPKSEETKAAQVQPAAPVSETKEIAPAALVSAADENPFLTPSEPRTSQVADEQPAKTEQVSEPASADKGAEADDENPFMAPKQKTEEPKTKISSND